MVAGLVLAMSAGHGLAQEATPPTQQLPAEAPAEPQVSPPEPAATPPVAEAPPAPPFKLVNARKIYKQKWRVVNLFIGACDYGVYGYGEQLVGGRQERLERRLKAHFGDRLNGHELVLDRYEFFQNAQINLIHATGAFSGGIIGGAMSSTYNLNCKRKDTKSGWYDTRMFPPDPAPYVVEITVKVDGQVVATSAAASPARVHTFKEEDLAEADIAAVIEAVQEVAIDDLIKRMEPLLPKP
ncbi:MAG: hypothetical protein K0R83_2257 [Caulobacter sp.]|jgi:hypothetical protein|nr:hypothetical protein [Caulobacter sp.]